ncbi:MAG: tetratricopeptide repeat protein [Lachnospiraceae bacterium]|nr:tetratricopeptide repeat protein [Lachnospiraceae bacterium]
MGKLDYITRGNSDPQGKERLFFACHPDDFKTYLGTICKEIFATQDCSIWYDAEPEVPWEPEEMEARLGRMQLFVIPITSRFLYQENAARETLFPFAVAHHIPVLPLMQESGLEEDFNQICGDIQFLDKNRAMRDRTELPYEQKLERFLSSVLLGNELAEKVRQAFDAYIFLSYRKKDRKYAQELMRLIHQNDFCRDIATWYDEFLVPSENFNHAILDALGKSNLFALVITPNLLEKDNYVMKEEYPAAKKADMPILPVEMESTNRKDLRENYEELPRLANAHNTRAFSNALRKELHGLTTDENRKDPEHLFLIGLAYLNGIDVEEDRERGAELITEAAEGGLPEAIEKLALMYRHGDGVERNHEKSAQYLERAARYWETQFAETGSEEDSGRWFAAQVLLAETWLEMRQMAAAEAAYQKVCEICKLRRPFVGEERYCIELTAAYDRLSEIAIINMSFAEAARYHSLILELSEKLFQTAGSAESRDMLLCEYLSWSRLCLDMGKLDEALDWAGKASDFLDRHYKNEITEFSCQNRSVLYDTLASIYEKQEKLPEAESCVQKALRASEKQYQINNSADAVRSIGVEYNRLGDICLAQGKIAKGREWYEKALDWLTDLWRQLGTIKAEDDAAYCYRKMGEVCTEEGHTQEALEWFQKAFEIYQRIYQDTGLWRIAWEVGVCSGNIGTLYKRSGNLELASKWMGESYDFLQKAYQETQNKDIRRDLSVTCNDCGDLCRRKNQVAEAKKYYEQALQLSESQYQEMGTKAAAVDLAVCYERLAELEKSLGRLSEAGAWYQKRIELDQYLCEKYQTAKDFDRLAAAFYNMGILDTKHYVIDYIEKAKAIWAELARQLPGEKRYADRVKLAEQAFAYAAGQIRQNTSNAQGSAGSASTDAGRGPRKDVARLLKKLDTYTEGQRLTVAMDQKESLGDYFLNLYQVKKKRLFKKATFGYQLTVVYQVGLSAVGNRFSETIFSGDTIAEVREFLGRSDINDRLDACARRLKERYYNR